MSAHPDRRPGRLYVVLAERFDCEGHSHVEEFVEVEDHEGRGAPAARSIAEGDCRLLEFPDPAAHAALEAEVARLRAIPSKHADLVESLLVSDRQVAALEAERDADRAMSVAFGKKLLEADAAHAALEGDLAEARAGEAHYRDAANRFGGSILGLFKSPPIRLEDCGPSGDGEERHEQVARVVARYLDEGHALRAAHAALEAEVEQLKDEVTWGEEALAKSVEIDAEARAKVAALEAENAGLRLRLADAWYSFEPAYEEARDPNTDPEDGADWWDSMDSTRAALDPKNEYRGNAALAPREAAHAALETEDEPT